MTPRILTLAFLFTVSIVSLAVAQSTATKPRIDFATYLSGRAYTEIDAVAVDAKGYLYVTGRTWASDFPTTPGALSRTPSQSCDQSGCHPYSGFAAKVSRDGHDLVYSTFLKGNAPTSIAVDSSGNAYISGDIVASDFVGTSGALYTKCNGVQQQLCNWITKLNPTGSAAVFSTLVNGSIHCMSDEEIAINSKGEIYIAGRAYGFNTCPTTTNAFRRTIPTDGGTSATQVMKFSADGSKLLYSTYVSSANPKDNFGGLAVDRNDHAIVVGVAIGDPFPTLQGAFQQTAKNGYATAFIAKLSSDGSALLASTLLGGSQGSEADDVAVDSNLNVYVTGITDSLDFPTTSGAYRRAHDTAGCPGTCSDIFVTKLSPSFGSLVYSTFFGIVGEDDPARLAIDPVGHVYLAGNTGNGLPLTKSLQSTIGPLFLTKFSTGGDKLLFSSYLGGTNQTSGATAHLAVDLGGNAYLGGFTASDTFPTTSGAYQTTKQSPVEAGYALKVNIPPCTLSSTSPSITICSPASGSSNKSPVLISAGATDDHSVNSMAIYLDGVKVFTISNQSHFDTKISMSSGSHKITVKAWDSIGRVLSKAELINVQ
jgi:hypothetical protein